MLAELQLDPAISPGIVLSRAHLWRVLKRLGLRLKKCMVRRLTARANEAEYTYERNALAGKHRHNGTCGQRA